MSSPLARALVLLVSVAASIASAPPDASVTGALEDRVVTLEGDAERTLSFRATLAEGSAGSGALTFTCVSDGQTPGGVRLHIVSDTTGESSEVDVIDVSDQPETSLSIGAFSGCTSGACEERGAVGFERSDGPDAAPLEMTWRLDARFTPDSGEIEGNSIEVTLVDE